MKKLIADLPRRAQA